VTNVIAPAERKSRITPSQAAAFIADVGKLDIEIDAEALARAFTQLLPLCRTHQLTSYDAIYLDLPFAETCRWRRSMSHCGRPPKNWALSCWATDLVLRLPLDST